MNMTTVAFFLIYVAAMAILLLVGGLWLLRKLYYGRKPHKTKRFVAQLFGRRGRLRGWRCLNNITLGSGADAVVVDHLVVGSFGVILACDIYQKGNIYGELEAAQWLCTIGEDGKEKKRETLESPYRRVRKAEELLRSLFAANKIYSVPVEVMIPRTGKQGCYITGSSDYALTRKELGNQLGRSRYEKDNNVPVERIVALFAVD